MKEKHQFTLVLNLKEPNDELENKLFEGGFDDSLLFFKDQTGYLDIEREARDFETAILEAIMEVEALGIKVGGVEPGDFVTAAEIARRLGRSKESLRLLISGERGQGGFPVPVAGVTGNTKIWRWSEVLDWLESHQKLPDKNLLSKAYTIREINESLAVRDNPGVYKKVMKLVGKLNDRQTL